MSPFLPPIAEILRTRVPTLVHVPFEAKNDWSLLFSEVANDVAQNIDAETPWLLLLMLAKAILPAPKRGGKRHQRNLAAAVKDRIRRWRAGEHLQLWRESVAAHTSQPSSRRRTHFVPHASQEDINGRRSRRLIQVGQYSRAAKALTSAGIDQSSVEALSAMREKHPVGPPPSLPTAETPLPLSLDAEKVAGALKSFKPGSAPGPSGLRAEHVKAALSSPTPNRAHRAITTLTNLVNALATGRLPPSVAPHFFGANLFAALKKDGGFRPVAVGETLRRLTSKCYAFEVSSRAADLLRPLQLAVGVKGGCESIVHALNALIANDDIPMEEKCILQVDFKNAFNLVNREEVFRQVRSHFPELSAWVEASYGVQAHLVFGSSVLQSCLGVHQGDPLATLLFSLALRPLACRIHDRLPNLKFHVWFADDGTVAGDIRSLAIIHDLLRDEGPALGLHLSSEKSSVWCGDLTLSDDPLHRGVPRSLPEGFEVLGSPIGSEAIVLRVLDKRVEKINQIIQNLHLLNDSQSEFALLHSCLSLPSFDYAARTTHPGLHAPSMNRFDGLMREAISGVLGRPLTDSQWLQASLPSTMGGLGLRKASTHSPASYLTSVAQTFDLTSSILAPMSYAPAVDEALALLNSVVDEPLVFEEIKKLPKKQITHSIDSRVKSLVLAGTPSIPDKARLSGVFKPHSGDWLNVVPSPALGLALHPQEFRTAALYRLGAAIFEQDNPCPACGRPSDRFGHHAIACGVHGERISRHNAICDILYKTAQKAGLGPAREFRGLIPGTAARPADVFLRNWDRGRDTALDVTVITPLQPAVVDREAQEPGYALRYAWDRKMRGAFDACDSNRISFIPLPVETFGGWHPVAVRHISRLGRELARSPANASQESTSTHLFQRLALAIQKGNAALILSRSTDIHHFDMLGSF